MNVSAVIVSRMNDALGEVVDAITPHVDELIIVRGVGGVWARYEAMERCRNEVIYTQDDDAVVDVPAVLRFYNPHFVTCNMPPSHRRDYPDSLGLVGWGAVFDRRRVDCHDGDSRRPVGHVDPFQRYFDWTAEIALTGGGRPLVYIDEVFRRECDRVFTGLSELQLIEVPFRHLARAHGADRMGREARHGADLQEIRRRIYAIRGA